MNLKPNGKSRMKHRLAALLLWPLGLLQGAVPESAEIPPDYHVVFQSKDEFAPVTIVCNADLDTARAEKLAADVRSAYQFVCETVKWSSVEMLKTALQVRVNVNMPKTSLGFAARDVFTIGLSYIDDPLAQGTLAHELTHCQDRRQLHDHRLPRYLAEGRALLNGRAFRMKLGQGPSAYDRGIRNFILKASVQEAEDVLSEVPGQPLSPNGPPMSRIEFMGCYFVDFLRVKCALPDIQPRTARLVMDMGQGMGYEEAFQKELGITLEEARSKFMAYLRDNAGPARLQGTVWQDL